MIKGCDLMADGYFEKQTTEEFTISVNFNNNLTDSETITTADVKVYLNNVDCTDDIIQSYVFNLGFVYIKVQGGTKGRKYKITTIITTSDDNTLESDVEMKIKND